MNESNLQPSGRLKLSAALARWVVWSLVIFWLLIGAAWGTLHGLIVPRIAEFRPALESRASQALGLPVHIGAIEAHSSGLLPSFELHDVTLSDEQGRVALILPRVVAAISPRSLWGFGFEQMVVDRPELEIRRTSQGRIVVAGLVFPQVATENSPAADWLFSQTELAIAKGIVHWTDELKGLPTLTLTDVDLMLRNSPRRHVARLDATPPPAWGNRFNLMAQFRQPLLSRHRGAWQTWTGQFYALFERVDVARLREQLDLGVEVGHGLGALRLWADLSRGQWTGAVADVALANVGLRLSPELAPLELTTVQGRLGGHRLAGGFDFSTSGLEFQTADGLRWPGGNIFVRYEQPENGAQAQGEFRADRMDLAALSQIANRIPLGDAVHQGLEQMNPKGRVETLQASWRGSPSGPERYSVKGRVTDLAFQARDPWPGVSRLQLDFDFDQSGGHASLAMDSGSVDLPGIFEEGLVPLDSLQGQLKWQLKGDTLAVQASDLRFANHDARGVAALQWRSADASKSVTHSRFPGVLDLSGTLINADGTRVHRYLPLRIPGDVRDYVRQAVTAGVASEVQFRVKGDLADFPFANARQGEFRVAAKIKDATFAYAPKEVLPAARLPWPALTQLSGDLIFERQSMQVRSASARFEGLPELQVIRADADIADLAHSVVGVDGVVRGPLNDALSMVNGSPLRQLTDDALAQASATGAAEIKLKLSLPLAQMERSKVQGSLAFSGNDVRVMPQVPQLSRVRGGLSFTDAGFVLNGVQARAFGGELKIEGGLKQVANPNAAEPPLLLRASGVATAEGLRQAGDFGLVSKLAEHASGSAPYALTVGFRRGPPEIQISSSLQGLALALPAPLNKAAETSLPFVFDLVSSKEPGVPEGQRDQLSLEIGRLVSARFVRDISAAQPRVLRGSVAVGLEATEFAPSPESGVMASLNLPKVDVDAWEKILGPAAGVIRAGASSPAAADSAAQSYLPSILALRAGELVVGGRTLNQVVVGGSREAAVWRANLDARELSGYLEYRQPGVASAGRLYARLSRLKLAQNTQSEVEALLDEQPASIPALDIVVEDFELRDKHLGRLEMEAVNRLDEGAQREWRLSKFNVLTPEATFTASGNWATLGAQAARPRRSAAEARRTVMNFRLDLRDAGELLKRFGMPGVVRQGHGHLEGQVAWIGSPLGLDYPSLGGQVAVNIETGQFLKADPGLAKLFGVLSLQALPRRLALDFRDVFSEGFSFDLVRGDVRVDQGIAFTNNLQMKGVNAAVLMEGQADLARETQDLKVVVVPEINAGTASLVATAINPAVGLGSFLAQLFLRRPLMEAATQEFHIDGTWTDPHITKLDGRKASSPMPGNGDIP